MLSVHGFFDPVPVLGATDTGGQVMYVLELAKALSELGATIDIFTRLFEEREEAESVNARVRLIRIPCGGREFIRKEDLLPHLDEYADNMARYISSKGLRYDILHSHYWDAGYVGMKIAERLALPFIYTAHSLGAWKKEQMGGDPEAMESLFRFEQRIRWEREIFRRATAQTVTTSDGREPYERLYGFVSDDIVVIPPGVDVRRFRPGALSAAASVTTPENYILTLGRLDATKGLDDLLRAYEIVSRSSPAQLVIGGGSISPRPNETEMRKSLLHLVDTLRLGGRVTFVGYIPDSHLATYYRNARLFVLPSKYEPFGMTVLEAMACGTPVVATRRGGLGHELTDRADSLLVDPSDPAALSSAILEILNDDSLARRLRTAGLKLVEERYSWRNIARQTLSFYDKYASARSERL
jgi:mannosylfructose-phosphate synthase